MTLRLAVLLGPSATVEAAELKMGALPGVLAMAVPFDGWNEAAASNILPTALSKVADMFLAGIKRGEHLAEPAHDAGGEAAEPPPDQPASPAPVVRASVAALYDAVLRELLGEPKWAEVAEAMGRARRIVALIEGATT